MRRSQRIQQQKQKTTLRLAAVPEMENEEEEVSVYGRSVNRMTTGPDAHLRCTSPVPPPLAEGEGPTVIDDTFCVTARPDTPPRSATLARIYTNFRGTPLHFWRRQAWINSSRRSIAVAPTPPPPSVQVAGGRSKLQGPSSSVGAAIEEEAEEQVNGKGETGVAVQGQDVSAQKSISAQEKEQEKEGTLLEAGRSTPAIFASHPEGTYRPPPSYLAAVAEQQQLAAMKVMTVERSENAAGSAAPGQGKIIEQQPKRETVSATTSNVNGNLEPLTPAEGQRTCWLDYSKNPNNFPNQVDASRLYQLKQQVEITCCTLYGRGENPNGNSIQEDLASRHSLLIQILNAGFQGAEQETAETVVAPESGAEVKPEEEQREEDLTKK